MPVGDLEAPGTQVKINQGNEREQGTGKCVEEKLKGGVNTARPSPDTNNHVHRN